MAPHNKSARAGYIYKIVNSVDNMIYIGSTMVSLVQRMHCHIAYARYCLNKTSKLYTHMREIGVDKFKIVLLREYNFISRKKLEIQEYAAMAVILKKYLLNTNTVYGIRSQQHSANLKIANTHRGCLNFIISRNVWQFRWKLSDSKQACKSFAVGKWGDDAYKNAKLLQDKMYPLE